MASEGQKGVATSIPSSSPLHNTSESSLTSTLVFWLYVCCDFQSITAVYHLISNNNFENYQKFSGNNWKYFWEILERIIRSSRGIIGSCLIMACVISGMYILAHEINVLLSTTLKWIIMASVKGGM